MMRRFSICFFILFSYMHAHAIEAVVSHTVFYIHNPAANGQLQPNVETSWQINPRTLHYITTPEKAIIARVKTDIVFTNDAGTVKEDHFIFETVPRHTITELNTHSIIDLRHYFVVSGTIRMKFTLTDLQDTTHHFVYQDSFIVAPVTTAPFYSELQLLDTTLPSPAQTIFLKNGQQQVPASTNFLDEKKSQLHYYAELYNANNIPKADLPLMQTIIVAKKENEVYSNEFMQKDTIVVGDPSVISGNFDISTLPSGNYYLCAKLENNAKAIIGSGTLFFQRLNTHPAEPKHDTSKKVAAVTDTGMESVNVLNLNKTFLAKYSLSDIRAILKMLLPVSNPIETKTINNFLKKPDEMYMRYYIYNYFSNINKKDPAAAWKAYKEKVLEVNRLFTRGAAGYETDRGFIYLRYGEPTEIVTVENEQGTLPYEIWQYNTLTEMSHKDVANAVFLFYKRNEMTSDYKLLHSTVTGEIQNSSWRSYLYMGGQGGNNGNSRAEQYIGNR